MSRSRRLKSEEKEYLDSLLFDPQGLHRQVCLGVSQKVPNLKTGELESIIHKELAHLVHPPLACPRCRHASLEGSESQYFTPSLVIQSASNQLSYVCSNCWSHTRISRFGNYSEMKYI